MLKRVRKFFPRRFRKPDDFSRDRQCERFKHLHKSMCNPNNEE